ncbi:MAG TPA: response regulator transcription factor [Acidimicrobiales bacterium]|nr:response regulator transcription factor [Acidimicrobiales bacterium]
MRPRRPLRLLLADDHTVLREALRRAVEAAGHEVVGEAGDGEEAVVRAEAVRPDCAVLDVSMPRLDGLGAARRISSLRVPVVMLTMHGDADTRALALDAGASAVLTKDCSVTDLLAAVEALVAPPAGAAAAARRDPTRLSARETEILRMLASGASTIEVSERLFISAVTVKNHLASIYRKLGCRGRTEAVVYALKTGLCDLAAARN